MLEELLTRARANSTKEKQILGIAVWNMGSKERPAIIAGCVGGSSGICDPRGWNPAGTAAEALEALSEAMDKAWGDSHV